MNSNCYIIFNDIERKCIIVDPGSKDSYREISYILDNNYVLDYIFLTHEHTDHTWGCNSLINSFPKAKVFCSSNCLTELPKAGDIYFRLYYDDPNYHYEVSRIDFTFEEFDNNIIWCNNLINIVPTPGHSIGSVCIIIGQSIFTGDTLMKFKPYISHRTGNISQLHKSIELLFSVTTSSYTVYPGHGDVFRIIDY